MSLTRCHLLSSHCWDVTAPVAYPDESASTESAWLHNVLSLKITKYAKLM